MFNNVGKKLKALAVFFFIIEVIAAIFVGYNYASLPSSRYFNPGIFILIIVGGFLVSWVVNLFLYGFGELIDSNMRIAEATEKKANPQQQ